MATLRSKGANLSFAKQRFDSNAKPSGRCEWNLDALIRICHIIREARGRSSSPAKAFLDMLIQRPE
eukprot:12929886-Prorocentrum_lima.AAC.1